MAPTVGLQAGQLLWALGLGAGLGFVYHLLRALRYRARPLTVPADLLYLLLTAWCLAWLGLAVCGGNLQLYHILGLLAGAWAYFSLGFRLLDGVLRGFWKLVFLPGAWFLKIFKKILAK